MFILDTNIVSDIRKLRRDSGQHRLIDWGDAQDPATLWLSVLTIFELEVGIRRIDRRGTAQGNDLRRWFDDSLRPSFQGRILPVTDNVAAVAAGFHVPDPAPLADSLIAATALVRGLTVVTRNVADFQRFPVSVLNPWGD